MPVDTSKAMNFRLPWRDYQARVLGELEGHLKDRKLHVVAAPGSGKTVLGLETVRRLGQPTLIFSPTITIRDQWINRLTDLFLHEGAETPDWISSNIRKPGAITSVTYQALHAAAGGREEAEKEESEDEEAAAPAPAAETRAAANIAALLKQAGIKTVVLDECHHLRSEWWNTLTATLAQLEGITTVALTATPPYDVDPQEWKRYQDLCGPIDAEISVPELVANRDLCPHQDYIFFSTPSPDERAQITQFRNDVRIFLATLAADQEFIAAMKNHPMLREPEKNIEAILDATAYYSSIAIFLHNACKESPTRLLQAMGMEQERIPPLTDEWWEELLTGCLFADDENLAPHKPVMDRVRKALSRIGAVERRHVYLRSCTKLTKLLTRSISKLAAIEQIVRMEHRALGPALRQVILTDFIRASDLPEDAADEKPIANIGVAPIFETLRRDGPKDIRLGILSGSLVVIPADAKPVALECAADIGIEADRIAFEPLRHDTGFLSLALAGVDERHVVRLITEIFARGAITVLVGTKSLLGEGWDAPSVNSLVLASFVGSFMLSNQMRGRAIRVQAGNPDKTANIWHLVCVLGEPGESIEQDWQTMDRRFQTFAGVSFTRPVIENGIARLGIGQPVFDDNRVKGINATTMQAAQDRAGLAAKWAAAIGDGRTARMVEELAAPIEMLPRPAVYHDIIAYLLRRARFIFLCVLACLPVAFFFRSVFRGPLLTAAYFSAVGAICASPYLLKALWFWIRHGSPGWRLGGIADALLESLCFARAIKTPASRLRVRIAERRGDSTLCHLDGGTTYEKTLFVNAMQELFAPVDNQRYLLARYAREGGIGKVDYHAVPYELARKKEFAEFFREMWQKYVAPTELVFTRNAEGRRILLYARSNSLSSMLLAPAERKSVWR